MSRAATITPTPPAVGDMTDELTTLLVRALGPGNRIQSIERQPSPFVTLFPAEILTLALSDGRKVRVFLKYLGAGQPDQPDKQRRDREVRVYEQLLAGGDGLP